MTSPESGHTPIGDMNNLDYLREVLAGSDERELARLQMERGLTTEQMRLARHYATLRHDVHEEMEKDLTRDEERFNIYETGLTEEAIDRAIEPQVRYAVRTLKQKGYETVSSGFGGIGETQHLTFQGSIHVPEDLVSALKGEGISVTVESDGKQSTLAYQTERLLTMDELGKIWKRIADAMEIAPSDES